MELNLKKLLPIGLLILAVMFIMKMMKGKRCEGFTQQKKPEKVACNCNISDNSGIENFARLGDRTDAQKKADTQAANNSRQAWAARAAANKGTSNKYSEATCDKYKQYFCSTNPSHKKRFKKYVAPCAKLGITCEAPTKEISGGCLNDKCVRLTKEQCKQFAKDKGLYFGGVIGISGLVDKWKPLEAPYGCVKWKELIVAWNKDPNTEKACGYTSLNCLCKTD